MMTPTVHHVPYAWIMAFDLNPLETLATKRKILPRAVREKWLCVFDHDQDVVAGRIVEESPEALGVVPAENFGMTRRGLLRRHARIEEVV